MPGQRVHVRRHHRAARPLLALRPSHDRRRLRRPPGHRPQQGAFRVRARRARDGRRLVRRQLHRVLRAVDSAAVRHRLLRPARDRAFRRADLPSSHGDLLPGAREPGRRRVALQLRVRGGDGLALDPPLRRHQAGDRRSRGVQASGARRLARHLRLRQRVPGRARHGVPGQGDEAAPTRADLSGDPRRPLRPPRATQRIQLQDTPGGLRLVRARALLSARVLLLGLRHAHADGLLGGWRLDPLRRARLGGASDAQGLRTHAGLRAERHGKLGLRPRPRGAGRDRVGSLRRLVPLRPRRLVGTIERQRVAPPLRTALGM